MFSMELQWKEFNVSLEMVEAAMRAGYEHYTGNQAHNVLELMFSEEPSDEDKDAIRDYWSAIESDSVEATSYKSAEDIESERIAKKASGKAKLIALGLTEEEAVALLG